MQQTFPAGKESKIIIKRVGGDLIARSWDQSSMRIETDGSIDQVYQEGDNLMIVNCEDDLALTVPPDVEIRAADVKGDVSIEHVRRVELEHVEGDLHLDAIGEGADIEQIGEAIAVSDVAGDLVASNASSLRARKEIAGDVVLTNVALVEMENVGGDLVFKSTETVVVGSVGGDLIVEDITDALNCGNVGGDCSIKGNPQIELTVGNIGSDLIVERAASVRLGAIGGDCVLRDVQKMVEIGNIGGDAAFSNVGTQMQVGTIGGDASAKGLTGSFDGRNIGGDLVLEASFPAGSSTRLHVGGDASVSLPDHPDLNIRAFAGGDISGSATASGGNGNWVNLAYGNSAAQLELHVGGDLNLRGGDQPRNSSASGGWGRDFTSEMDELERLGQELGHMGQEIGREVSEALKQAGWAGSRWADSASNKINEQMRRAQRKAEEQARKAEERAHKASGQNPRMRVRFNDREWQLDPERLERIKAQASKAASEGISNAMEAVERAIGNLHVPQPSRPPTPPRPPEPPRAGQPGPSSVVQNAPRQTPGDTPPSTSAETSSDPAPDLDQEREAILRMIAEGRISPEEGDLLLEGLGG